MRLFALVLVFVFSLGLADRALAADGQAPAAHAASPAALDAALQQHATTTAAQRDAVIRVLDRAEVKEVAGRIGIDLRQAKSAVATMDAQQLAQVSQQARQVDQALVGGASSVVISTTTIIIALLVVILIIVAVD